MSKPDIIGTVVGHLVDESADGALRVVEALVKRVGAAQVQQHLDMFQEARKEADAAEKKKFGFVSRWFSK